MSEPIPVAIEHLDGDLGRFVIAPQNASSPIWARIRAAVIAKGMAVKITNSTLQMSWPDALTVVREFGTRATQRNFNFRFIPDESAKGRLAQFAEEVRHVSQLRDAPSQLWTVGEIESRLTVAGFSRKLKPFQLRDIARLLSLKNGANFSVPGAGKTTVTFALHLLLRKPGQKLFVVAPKAAFQAWRDIIADCVSPDADAPVLEPFTVLDGRERDTSDLLASGAARFLISYDLLIRQQGVIEAFFATNAVHLVLDEAHRMKAGMLSQRGAYLLRIATLPVRRDILTGTPMPQSASDIESQLDFLWPGHGLGAQVMRGSSPREVLGNMYVRTTKKELEIPDATRTFIDVDMKPGQLALYSVVRSDFLSTFASQINRNVGSILLSRARRSVMRLLQLSVNPIHALTAMVNDDCKVSSGIVDAVLEERHSAKLSAVMAHARALAAAGEKVVLWTIFTDTIRALESALAELNPVVLHGGVPSGPVVDLETREGRVWRFHKDPDCHVLIANPAAAGEGISLHTVCHNAIYVDRSYVSTHYLQSIDRIHRLGLPDGQRTDIFIYRSKAPREIGSIDLSVSRRLTDKIRNMQQLLDDPDLHQIALDEEEADDPIDFDLTSNDLIDLIQELEGRISSGNDFE